MRRSVLVLAFVASFSFTPSGASAAPIALAQLGGVDGWRSIAHSGRRLHVGRRRLPDSRNRCASLGRQLLALQHLGERMAGIDSREDALDALTPCHDHRAVLVLGHDLEHLIEWRVARHDKGLLLHRLFDAGVLRICIREGFEEVQISLGDDSAEVAMIENR